MFQAMKLISRYITDISVIYRLSSPAEISVQNTVPIISTILTGISPIFPISVPFFLVLPFVFLLIAAISLQKVNLLMVGEDTKLLVLNCYIYKFSMILILPISHHDN
ncbi:hypothetical protein Hanom_Chr06g00492711 [Helianthus anomalus]